MADDPRDVRTVRLDKDGRVRVRCKVADAGWCRADYVEVEGEENEHSERAGGSEEEGGDSGGGGGGEGGGTTEGTSGGDGGEPTAGEAGGVAPEVPASGTTRHRALRAVGQVPGENERTVAKAGWRKGKLAPPNVALPLPLH